MSDDDGYPSCGPRLGAYGLSVRGLAGAAPWMQPQPPDAPTMHVRVRTSGGDDRPSRVDDGSADLRLLGGGRLQAQRGEAAVDYMLPAVPPDGDLLHPYLAPAAALWWRWLGREALHGGAFEGRGGAVLVLGGTEAGKSTTLAWLADAGAGILTDDLAILDGRQVLAGPRSIDLRTAATVPPGSTAVRSGARARVTLPSAPARIPLAGVAVLVWGPVVDVTAVPVEQRWPVLAPQRMYPSLGADPVSLLDLVAAPMTRFTRPRDPATLAAVGRAMLREFS